MGEQNEMGNEGSEQTFGQLLRELERNGLTDEELEQAITELKNTSDRNGQIRAAIKLHFADVRAENALINALENSELIVKVQVVGALGKFGTFKAIGPLIKLAKRIEFPQEVIMAIEAIHQRDLNERIKDYEEQLLHETFSPKRRSNAAETLVNLGEHGLQVLMDAIKYNVPYVRNLAATALGNTDSPKAQAALEEAFEHEHDIYLKNIIKASIQRIRNRNNPLAEGGITSQQTAKSRRPLQEHEPVAAAGPKKKPQKL